jgi:peptide/nickel transport system substrate-binding protein
MTAPRRSSAAPTRRSSAAPDRRCSAAPTRRSLLRGIGGGAVGLAALPLAGCALTGASGAVPDTSDAADDELSFLISNFDSGWVVSKSSYSSYECNVWEQLTDRLIYVEPDRTLKPWIAESWEQDEDSTEFILHLVTGASFSDGTPLDADAVAENIEVWAKGRPDQGVARVGLFPAAGYEGAKALDEHTVRVTFSAPALSFLPTLGYIGCPLISPASLDLDTEQQADLSRQIGSGPFVVESWARNDHVTLVRREDYDWAPPSAGHTGPAHLHRIRFRVLPDDVLRASAAQAGQTDVAYNVNPQVVASLKKAGLTVDAPRYNGFVHGFQIRTNNPPYDEPKVRRALQHGIDRDEILATVFTPDWKPATSFLQSAVPEASDVSDAFAFDPDLSSSLLDEAGWTGRNEHGIRTKNGTELTLDLLPTPFLPGAVPLDELLAQQLGRLGFRVSTQKLDVATWSQRSTDNPAQAVADVTRSFVDVGTVAGILTDDGEDWFQVGSSDTTLNDLRDRIAGAVDTESRAEVVHELERYVVEQGYFIPIEENAQRIYVQSPAVTGVRFNALAVPSYYDARKKAAA